MRPQLHASAEARRTARFLLFPPLPRELALAAPGWPAYVGIAGLAFALLPRWARRTYRLPGVPVMDVAASVAVRALRLGLVRLPAGLREGPHLRDARARLALSGDSAHTGVAL